MADIPTRSGPPPAGVTTLASPYGHDETVRRLEAELAGRGIQVFARIDHTANASAVGLVLPPTLVVIFGSAQTGTPLMAQAPGLALDLPLRILIASTPTGVTVSYHDPAAMAAPYGLTADDVRPLHAVAVIAAAVVA
jgi:uncharacterized protein (DUF302 family)